MLRAVPTAFFRLPEILGRDLLTQLQRHDKQHHSASQWSGRLRAVRLRFDARRDYIPDWSVHELTHRAPGSRQAAVRGREALERNAPNLLARYFYLWEPTMVRQVVETA